MPWVIFALALAVYWVLAPGVSGMGDGPEFTVGLATAGLVHPTGYPAYVVTGHLFASLLHSLGAGWAWAANAWSGVGAAAASGIFAALAVELGSPSVRGKGRAPGPPAPGSLLPWAVAASTVLFALHPLLVAEAVEAEINTWAAAWTLGAALLFARAVVRIDAGRRPTARDALAWGLMAGLGLAHHATSALVILPLTAALGVVLARRRLLTAAHGAVVAAGACLVILLGVAFVAWRASNPAPGQWADIAAGWDGVLEHVTGHRYRMFLGFFAPDAESRRVLGTWVYPVLFPGLLLLGIAAASDAASQRRVLLGALFAAALLGVLFTFRYGVPDPAPYLLPALGIALLGIPAALAGPIGSPRARALLVVAALIGAGITGWGGLRQGVALREEAERFERDVRRIWALVPEERAIVLWPADQAARLVEYQVLRGEKRNAWAGTPEALLDAPVRRRIASRFGVDPVAGLSPPHAPRNAAWGESARHEFLALVVRRLNDGTDVPVYWFDLAEGRLARLPKAAPRD